MRPKLPALCPRRLRGRWALGVLLALLAVPASGRTVNLTVLHTTDLHGSIRRTPDVYAVHNDGSLLQCATLIRRIREEAPNVLLLDSGDVFQGTAESHLTRGGIMARAMNALRYDAFAVGNHEFDWGVAALAAWIESMDATPLAANLTVQEPAPAALHRILPYIIREMDGITIAIVGLTTPNIPRWFPGLAGEGIHVMDSRRALESTLPQVRRHRPDILILIAHQGLLARDDDANEIQGIARRFGEFDLILGGHLHWVVAGARIGRVHYAQSGSGARGLMRIDLAYDTVRKAVVDRTFEYLPVTDDIPEDPELAALLADDLARADQWLATVLGRTAEALHTSQAGAGINPVQQLICASIAHATGAEVVIHGTLSRVDIPAGGIRIADVWRMVPYENTIGTVWLNRAEIKTILDEFAGHLGTDRYAAAWGLRYEMHTYAPPGRRIRNLRDAEGRPLHAHRRIPVALNSHQLAGGGGRFPHLVDIVNRPNARLRYTTATTRDMVMDYIRLQGDFTSPPGTNVVVIRRE